MAIVDTTGCFAKVTATTGRDQIAVMACPALSDGDNMIDVQDRIRSAGPTVKTGKEIAIENVEPEFFGDTVALHL
jgi:hypothetical protein